MKQYAEIFGKGLLCQEIPDIVAGMLVEFLKAKQVNRDTVTDFVSNNRSLLDLNEQQRNKLRKNAQRAGLGGDMEWLTAEWAINAIKKEMPRLASMIRNWPEAYNWLEEQVEELKGIVKEE